VSRISEISNAYVADYARLSPMLATSLGLPGAENRLDDLSPAGIDEVNDLVLSTLRALDGAEATTADEVIAGDVLRERLEVERDVYDSGWLHANLNVIDSPLQAVRMVFDLMPTESDHDVAVLAERMTAVPAALSGYRESLRFAADAGKVSAVRQIDKCAEQCDTYAGMGGTGFFAGLAESVNPAGVRGSGLSGPLATSANSSAPSCVPTPRNRTPSGGNATSLPPATSWVPSSISRRPTPGAGRNSWPSRRKCGRWRSGSRPVPGPRTPLPCSTPTPVTS
jgi:hypothetical protein